MKWSAGLDRLSAHRLRPGQEQLENALVVPTVKHNRGHIHNISSSSYLMNGPNKLECLSLASLSSLVRVFVPGKPLQPKVIEHSILLGPYLGFEGKEVL